VCSRTINVAVARSTATGTCSAGSNQRNNAQPAVPVGQPTGLRSAKSLGLLFVSTHNLCTLRPASVSP
jgi:hypothetical protein